MLERQRGAHAESAFASWAGFERAAVERGAFAHADQAVAGAVAVPVSAAGSVVDHFQAHLIGLVTDEHSCAGVTGVLTHVGQRLLHDAVGGELDPWRERLRVTLDCELGREAGGAYLLDQ